MKNTLTLRQLKNDKIDSQSHEEIRKRLLLKKPLKVINLVLFDIENHEKEILAVGYNNKTIETKYKWNQINILGMQSLLGTNCRRPLLHMSKSYILLKEKNQCINEFSIGYMMNPNLNTNKSFRDQVKVCLKTHLVQIPI